jgi:hypothetical protein
VISVHFYYWHILIYFVVANLFHIPAHCANVLYSTVSSNSTSTRNKIPEWRTFLHAGVQLDQELIVGPESARRGERNWTLFCFTHFGGRFATLYYLTRPQTRPRTTDHGPQTSQIWQTTLTDISPRRHRRHLQWELNPRQFSAL